MYDGLFQPSPTHVFLFLGHNDSKVSSTSNYTAQAVLPDKFEADYGTVLEKIRAETKAKIILLSASSSVFEICQANAGKATAANRTHSLFGKPEELERYNALTERIAAQAGAAYLDVYEPTRTHPDKRSLFDPNDGVHLTNAGNRFLALRLLEFLGGQ
jgi:lysophospholipase L1-like esterase